MDDVTTTPTTSFNWAGLVPLGIAAAGMAGSSRRRGNGAQSILPLMMMLKGGGGSLWTQQRTASMPINSDPMKVAGNSTQPALTNTKPDADSAGFGSGNWGSSGTPTVSDNDLDMS